MKYTLRTLVKLVIVGSSFIAKSAFAQAGISLYPLNNTIGFKTSNLKPVSFELRLNYDISHSTADLLYMFQPEANFIYRVKREERANFYTGIGAGYGINNANGNYSSATLLIGIEIYPILSMRNITLTAELDPNAKIYTGYQTFKLSGLIGVSYYFAKIKNAKTD